MANDSVEVAFDKIPTGACITLVMANMVHVVTPELQSVKTGLSGAYTTTAVAVSGSGVLATNAQLACANGGGTSANSTVP